LPSAKSLSALASQKKLVFLGEFHEFEPCIGLQLQIQKDLLSDCKAENRSKLHIVLEHFNFDMQDLLNGYMTGSYSFGDLQHLYEQIGQEGHQIGAYRACLEHAKANSDYVRLHAGFIPRSFAKVCVGKGEEVAIPLARSQDFLPSGLNKLEGTEFHYSMFESMITQRPLFDPECAKPSDQFRKIFKAQVLKDEAMAYKITKILGKASLDDKVLAVLGYGHCQFGSGVPERVFKKMPSIED
jgi:uncharacterized iron-regulated protein